MFARAPTDHGEPRTIAFLMESGTRAGSTATTIGTVMNSSSPINPDARRRAFFGIAGVALLAACASTPPPTAKLQAARDAIATAEQAQAGQYAGSELSEARLKIAAADTAVHDQNMIGAARLAEESNTEADLAIAKTADVKANAVNADMQHSNSTLINEMQRSDGATP
jgi:hypothetical protein